MSRRSQYLLALYIAEHGASPPTSSSTVAELLDRTAGTATEMFYRLESAGLVEYEPYEGATLTPAGREEAAELHESYVTLSWFFRSVLGLEDCETEAMELADVVSPEVVREVAATLPYEGDESEREDPPE